MLMIRDHPDLGDSGCAGEPVCRHRRRHQLVLGRKHAMAADPLRMHCRRRRFSPALSPFERSAILRTLQPCDPLCRYRASSKPVTTLQRLRLIPKQAHPDMPLFVWVKITSRSHGSSRPLGLNSISMMSTASPLWSRRCRAISASCSLS
jgi:hypothetical protein